MRTTNTNGILAAATAVALLPIAADAAPKKAKTQQRLPNILCVTCEDISCRLGCYGDPTAVTPNLDAFAQHAIRYTDMFTTVGVSAPSRSALITGMYPSTLCSNNMRVGGKDRPEGIPRYAVVPPTGVKCYTEYMRAAGYYCTNNSKCDYQFGCPLTAWDESSGKAHWKNAPEGAPFFAIFNLNITHESQIWKGEKRKLTIDPADVVVPPYFPDDEVSRRTLAILYSNIKLMDQQFQDLVDEVEAAGKLDNTIIIWYSDNGGPLPREKRSLYDTGTKVPFMISFPDGYKAGTVDKNLHMFPDIPATILSLAGINPPDYMQGEAFLGKYAEKNPREYVYGARTRMGESVDKQGAVRDHHYRYLRNYNSEHANYGTVAYRLQMPLMTHMLDLKEQGLLNRDQMQWFLAPRPVEEFYDLDKDPYELHNEIDNPAYEKDIARLKAEYNRWIAEECPRWDLTEIEAIETMWPGGIQPVVKAPKVEMTPDGVLISSDEDGVSFAYQINGKGMNEKHWYLYNGPVQLKKGDRMTTVAVRAGMRNSKKIDYVYE